MNITPDTITQKELTKLQQNIIDGIKNEISNGNTNFKDETHNLNDTVIKRL